MAVAEQPGVDPGNHQPDDLTGRLLSVLRRASGDEGLTLTGSPRPVNAKGSVLFVDIRSSRGDLTGPAVVRISGEPEVAERETRFQSYLHEIGYPTPEVVLSGETTDDLDGAWLLTELVDGLAVRVRSGRNLSRVLTSLGMLWQRPLLLADMMARLHSVDTEPLMTDQDGGADGSDFDWYTFQIDLVGRLRSPTSDRLLEWLETNRPDEPTTVVSHGDLHPGNIVIGPDGPMVIDWGIATLAPPARDVACTMFALENTGSLAPKPVRPLAGVAGQTLSGRFLRRYRERCAVSVTDEQLNWHQVLYAANRIYWAARFDQRGRLANMDDELAKRANRHGQTALGKELPGHRRLIGRLTGIEVDETSVAGLVFPD